MIAFLDTHALLLLETGRVERFGAESRRLIAVADLMVTPVVRLELHFMAEVGRMVREPDHVYSNALAECNVREASDPIAAVVAEARSLAWTRDPFDRLLVATAILHRAKLITKDANIRDHFDGAVW